MPFKTEDERFRTRRAEGAGLAGAGVDAQYGGSCRHLGLSEIDPWQASVAGENFFHSENTDLELENGQALRG
jgi:hypothetical protein